MTCGQNLPSNFCCEASSTCQVFNGGLSVLCCPSGSNCSSISPITCNIQELNATANPQNPLHSTDLTTQPSTCGVGCCPAGYTCNSSGLACDLNSTSSSSSTPSSTTSPISAASGTSTRAITTSTATSTATSTPSSGASTQSSVAATACNPYPIPAILAAFFPGLIIGIVLTLLVIMCCGKKRDSKRTGSDFGHINATVSDPIYQDSGATRTDFLRRESKTKNSAPTTSRVRSLFSRAPSIARHSPPNDAVPRTPENRPRREPSMESITIYSPPDGRFGSSDVGSRQTTITDMMKQVGLDTPPYATYLGSPGRVDPRSKAIGNGRLR